jgi:hypothetical protein
MCGPHILSSFGVRHVCKLFLHPPLPRSRIPVSSQLRLATTPFGILGAILVLVCTVMWGNFLLFSARVKEQETRWNPLIDGFLAFQSLTLFLPTFGCAWGAELRFYSKIVSNSPYHYSFERNSDSPLSDCKNSFKDGFRRIVHNGHSLTRERSGIFTYLLWGDLSYKLLGPPASYFAQNSPGFFCDMDCDVITLGIPMRRWDESLAYRFHAPTCWAQD